MESLLGEKFTVIEEGLNGRTLLPINPLNRKGSGILCIEEVSAQYLPRDIVTIYLGSNDLFDPSEVSLDSIALGMHSLIRKIKDLHVPAQPVIIIIGPPATDRNFDGARFFELQINKVAALGPLYKKVAEEESVHYFDSSKYIKTAGVDCSHIDGENHRILGRELTRCITEILS
jgi:lysophospholipase L1-like esterase